MKKTCIQLMDLDYSDIERVSSSDCNHCQMSGTYSEDQVGTALLSQSFASPALDGMSFNIRSLFGSLHNKDCTMLFLSIFFSLGKCSTFCRAGKSSCFVHLSCQRALSSYPLLVSSLSKIYHCTISFCTGSHLEMPLIRTMEQPK